MDKPKIVSLNNEMFEIGPNGLQNKITGEVIPSDEPIFILRASDSYSMATLRSYQSHFRINEWDFNNCATIIEKFQKFQGVNDAD